jgi:HEAT repeat protein
MRPRTLISLLLLFPLPLVFPRLAVADESTQIAWVGDWETAFKQAKSENKPVMVCINSIDSEVANKRAAKQTYRNPTFVAASRKFVMIVVSNLSHRNSGPCSRFGVITCEQHNDCYKELRARHGETFHSEKDKGMISPQHAWFRSDGTLLRRKDYELTQPELLKRMRAVVAEVTGKPATAASGEGAESPDGIDDRKKPLDEKDKKELERLKQPGEAKKEDRRAALDNLLATEKYAVHGALMDLLKSVKPDVRCDILRALGRAQIAESLELLHHYVNKDKEPVVRSFAAVALEQIASEQSIPVLIKRAKKERDATARKNMYRALGACGGGAKSKDAAKALLKAISSDKQAAVKKHAAIACRAFEGEDASVLVLSKLEKLALKTKDRGVRVGIVYSLAYIGNLETTLPILVKVRDSINDGWRKAFVRSAISVLKGEGGDFGRSDRFVYWEDRDDPARE